MCSHKSLWCHVLRWLRSQLAWSWVPWHSASCHWFSQKGSSETMVDVLWWHPFSQMLHINKPWTTMAHMFTRLVLNSPSLSRWVSLTLPLFRVVDIASTMSKSWHCYHVNDCEEKAVQSFLQAIADRTLGDRRPFWDLGLARVLGVWMRQ